VNFCAKSALCVTKIVQVTENRKRQII